MESEHAVDTRDVTGSDSAKYSPPEICGYVFHFIFPNKNGDHVLAEVLPNGVAKLPRINYSERSNEDALERCIEAEFGLSVYLVRMLSFDELIDSSYCIEMNYLYLGKLLDTIPVVRKPYEWIHRNVACVLKWVATNGDEEGGHIRTELKRVFGDMNGEIPLSDTHAWDNVEWYGEITSWSQAVLEARNMVMEGKIRQQSRTDQSVVVTCKVRMRGKRRLEGNGASCELIFIKRTIPAVREVERTVAVAGIVGNIVPEIIGFQAQRGLLMMRSGGKVMDEAFDQEALFDTVLKIQRLSTNRISELEADGLRVRDSEWVESNVDSILNHELLDKYYVREGDVNQEDKEIVDNIRGKVGLIQKKCREITKLGLPRTLVHGDLYEANVGSPVRSEGKVYRIFDWARSFIGNPLQDFESLLPWEWGSVGNKSGEFPIDLDAGIKQICKAWKACGTLTWEEMKSVFRTLSDMNIIIRVHDLIEEYEGWDDSNRGRSVAGILGELGEWMEAF